MSQQETRVYRIEASLTRPDATERTVFVVEYSDDYFNKMDPTQIVLALLAKGATDVKSTLVVRPPAR